MWLGGSSTNMLERIRVAAREDAQKGEPGGISPGLIDRQPRGRDTEPPYKDSPNVFEVFPEKKFYLGQTDFGECLTIGYVPLATRLLSVGWRRRNGGMSKSSSPFIEARSIWA